MLESQVNADIHFPLITIVTVVCNGEKYIEGTIRSIMALQYPNLEYIVIDGSSVDGTVDIIKRYEGTVTYWVSENDNGIYDAMNKGWAACKPDSFILFLGAGDRILSLPAMMQSYTLHDVIYGTVKLGDGKNFLSKAGLGLRIRNTLHHQALLINKATHPERPFDIRFKVFADFDFNQRLLKKGINFIYSDSFVGYAMPEGVSSKFDLVESLQIIRKNFGVGWCFLSLLYFVTRRIFVYSKHLFNSIIQIL